jgi:D-3-phosphoglycerate dehydrogenase
MTANRHYTVLIADKLASSVVDRLSALVAEVRNEPNLSADDLRGALKGVDILIVRSTKVTFAALEAADTLSLIIRAGAGVNTIDVAAASARGIQVANCPGVNAAAVAELAIGLLIAADRRIVDACADLRQGRWRKAAYGSGYGLKGRTLGLLGYGSIGKAVGAAAQGLGMRVMAWSRSLTDAAAESYGIDRAVDPIELAASSDAVSIHIAYVPETRHLVNQQFLSAMRDGSILINTSRGEIVDTAALREALDVKKLRVAADVFEHEPEGGEADFKDIELASRITATPHIGASTAQTSEAIGAEVVRIVEQFVHSGRSPGTVNICAKSPATFSLVVRHYNRVGVLASVLDALRAENINVEEMENTIFEGGKAALCCLRLDDRPSSPLVEGLARDPAMLKVSLRAD